MTRWLSGCFFFRKSFDSRLESNLGQRLYTLINRGTHMKSVDPSRLTLPICLQRAFMETCLAA